MNNREVGAKNALYRETGDWYHILQNFPGALFDPNGYVVFRSEEEFNNSPYLKITQHIHVPGSLENIPAYVRASEGGQFHKLSLAHRNNPAERKLVIQNRIIRDTKVSSFIKELYNYRCQIYVTVIIGDASKVYRD